jgi:biotin operon repressor
VRRRGLYNELRVFEAIRLRGTMPFSGAAIAAEAGVCRQTVYKIIDKLIDQGHRIEGAPRLGFMARLKDNSQPHRRGVESCPAQSA